jgi:hypothetical protein
MFFAAPNHICSLEKEEEEWMNECHTIRDQYWTGTKYKDKFVIAEDEDWKMQTPFKS